MEPKWRKLQLIKSLIIILCLTANLSEVKSRPTVDPGVFVLQGISTCREGRGYCLLGLSCSIDKDFAKDEEGGHCDGLTKSFTSKISFVCCKYVNESKIKIEVYETTISPFTLSDEKFQILDEHPIHVDGDEERVIPEGVDPSSLIDIVGVVTDATGIVRLITKPYEIPNKILKNDTQEATTPLTVPELPNVEELDENTENYNALPTDIDIKVIEEKNKLVDEEADLELQLNFIKEEPKEVIKKEESVQLSDPIITIDETGNKNQQEILIPHHFLKPFAEDDSSHKVYNDISSYTQPVTASTNLPIEMELKMREEMIMSDASIEATNYGLMLPSDEEEEKQKVVTINDKKDSGLLKPYAAGEKETSALFQNSIGDKRVESKIIEKEQQVGSVINVLYQSKDKNNLLKYKEKVPTHVNETPIEISVESLIVSSPVKMPQVVDSEDDYIEESSLPHPVNLNICGIKKTYSQHRHRLRRTEAASVYEWCWSAALMRKGGSSDKFECSGALIELDMVVTSAACLKRLRKEDISSYRIVLGDSNLRDDLPYGIQFHDISEIITHPDYLTSGGSHANDIGLIRLKDYATVSENVCLVCVAQRNSFIPDSSCIVSGYTGGDVPRQKLEDVSPAILPEGTLRVAPVELEASIEDCTSSLISMARSPLLLQRPETFLCDRRRKSAKCLDNFDGGSPLVCQAGGRWFLSGITSWSRDCNTEPNVYTKVSSHSDWILSTRLRMHGFASHEPRLS